jgi:hydrogenase maturation factor
VSGGGVPAAVPGGGVAGVSGGGVPSDSLAAAALTLARRFAAGATMWCVAPEWPSHSRHVAVEFVHPVIVGKRALPAIHVEGPAMAATLRLLVHPGDILLAVGPASETMALLLQRAEAWGLTTVWLGVGPPARQGSATHIVWSPNSDADRAARGGDVVLLYHVLWELTHVVFEHPGLLSEPDTCAGEVCVTCSDEGRVAEVIDVLEGGQAEVVSRGARQIVDVSLVGPVLEGDLLLVHAGTALATLPGTTGPVPR